LRKQGGALQNPAYRPADVYEMRGSAERAGPLAIFDSHYIFDSHEKTSNTHSATILSNNAISASGAVTFGEWLASISK